MKKLLVVVIGLSLIAAAGLFGWKVWRSGGFEDFDIFLPDGKDDEGVFKKDTIGVQKNEDGSYTFTDTPEEGMEIRRIPSPEEFKEEDGYHYGPGSILPDESGEDE